MKLLKVVSGNDSGGIFTCETQFIKYWISQGVIVDVIIIGGGEAAQKYKDIASNYQQVENLNAQYSGSLLRIIKALIESKRFSKELVYELKFKGSYNAVIYRRPIFIHIAGIMGKSLDTKVFWHLPNFINRRLGKGYYNFYMDKYKIEPIANSTYTKNTIGKRCNHVIYPGFDKERVKLSSDENFRAKLNISKDSIVFGIAARINRSKAQDLVVAAMVNSGAFEKHAHLIIAGETSNVEYMNECRKIAGKYLPNLHFVGKITDLPRFYSTIDVYINSRRNEEPFGISIAEAMGAGLPVIAYHLGGPSEMIIDEKNGWLVKEPTEAAYTLTLSKCLKEANQWKQMGEFSLLSSAKYDAAINAERFLEIIKKKD